MTNQSITNPNEPLSATVLPVSEQNIDETVAALEALQFEVQKIIGGSLVISATREVFSQAFDYAVAIDDQQQAFFLVKGDALSELTQPALPARLATVCTAVELHRPPAFGPGNFG